MSDVRHHGERPGPSVADIRRRQAEQKIDLLSDLLDDYRDAIQRAEDLLRDDHAGPQVSAARSVLIGQISKDPLGGESDE